MTGAPIYPFGKAFLRHPVLPEPLTQDEAGGRTLPAEAGGVGWAVCLPQKRQKERRLLLSRFPGQVLRARGVFLRRNGGADEEA